MTPERACFWYARLTEAQHANEPLEVTPAEFAELRGEERLQQIQEDMRFARSDLDEPRPVELALGWPVVIRWDAVA